jgi:hypothetical protein
VSTSSTVLGSFVLRPAFAPCQTRADLIKRFVAGIYLRAKTNMPGTGPGMSLRVTCLIRTEDHLKW